MKINELHSRQTRLNAKDWRRVVGGAISKMAPRELFMLQEIEILFTRT